MIGAIIGVVAITIISIIIIYIVYKINLANKTSLDSITKQINSTQESDLNIMKKTNKNFDTAQEKMAKTITTDSLTASNIDTYNMMARNNVNTNMLSSKISSTSNFTASSINTNSLSASSINTNGLTASNINTQMLNTKSINNNSITFDSSNNVYVKNDNLFIGSNVIGYVPGENVIYAGNNKTGLSTFIGDLFAAVTGYVVNTTYIGSNESSFGSIVNFDSNITVSGNTQMKNLNATNITTGEATIKKMIGNTKFDSMSVTGNTTLSNVSGDPIFTGNPRLTNVTVSGLTKNNNLSVTGSADIANINSTGTAYLNNLNIKGTTTFKNNITNAGGYINMDGTIGGSNLFIKNIKGTGRIIAGYDGKTDITGYANFGLLSENPYDKSWTAFPWSDNSNYIRGPTNINGMINFNSNININSDTLNIKNNNYKINALANLDISATNLNINSPLTVNQGINDGSQRGINLWHKDDKRFGMWMGDTQAHGGKSLTGGPVASGDIGNHSVRFSTGNWGGHGFVFQNSDGKSLMSIKGDDARTNVYGELNAMTDLNVKANATLKKVQTDNINVTNAITTGPVGKVASTIDSTGKATFDQLCVGKTCVNETQLASLVGLLNMNLGSAKATLPINSELCIGNSCISQSQFTKLAAIS